MSGRELILHLKARREALGWSVGRLAEDAGLDEKSLAQWERGSGSPQLESVESWASALGLVLSLSPAEGAADRGLQVDWQARRISIDGSPIRLTPMEWKALERLAAAPGELVPHLALFRHLYGEDEPYRAHSTAIRVLITKLRRLLPPLRIEAQWGKGYVIGGIAPSRQPGAAAGEAPEPAEEPAPVQPEKPREGIVAKSARLLADAGAIRRKLTEMSQTEMRRVAAAPPRPNAGRVEELLVIERFLSERGVTRCPDVATIQHAPLPTLVWDKLKRKWVRPPAASCEAS